MGDLAQNSFVIYPGIAQQPDYAQVEKGRS
jgi:hypothetical protein